MNQKLELITKSNIEFQNIIKELVSNETVQEMKKYRQHFETSCFEHCYIAAYYCYVICKKFNLDYKSATRAAMLHDLFLYDWRIKSDRNNMHAFTHGKIACENACKIFQLSEKEKDIIIKHMWPVTIVFPKSKEGMILTFVDKYCAITEMFENINVNINKIKVFNYIYIFMCLIISKIERK